MLVLIVSWQEAHRSTNQDRPSCPMQLNARGKRSDRRGGNKNNKRG